MFLGGDLNRPPEQLVEESTSRYCAIRTHAPIGVFSTCSNGGLIDYFVTHENEHQILADIKVIKDTVVTPHSPVAATINEALYTTKTLQQVAVPKWPEGEPAHERRSWEEAQEVMQELKWSIPHTRCQDAEKECYVKHLDWHTAGMHMADV